MPMWNHLTVTMFISSGVLVANLGLSAGLDTLSKDKPELPASKPVTKETVNKKTRLDTAGKEAPDIAAPVKPLLATPPASTKKPVVNKKTKVQENDEKSSLTQKKPDTKAVVVRSQLSKAIEDRLSLATSLGWAVIKPSKGEWTGIGASDLSLRWRESVKDQGKVFITVRYVPLTGVWTVDSRDYDTSLHGIYGGAEYQKSIELMGAPTIRTGVELGYMLVYARPQDKAEVDGDVKGGKFNLAASGGAEWDILNGKVKVGPFARLQAVGFTIFNVGGSVNFVF
jgi:hypothetical protein